MQRVAPQEQRALVPETRGHDLAVRQAPQVVCAVDDARVAQRVKGAAEVARCDPRRRRLPGKRVVVDVRAELAPPFCRVDEQTAFERFEPGTVGAR